MSVLQFWLEMMRKETFLSQGETRMGFLRNKGLLSVLAEMEEREGSSPGCVFLRQGLLPVQRTGQPHVPGPLSQPHVRHEN